MSFEDILAGMGIDGAAVGAGAASRAGPAPTRAVHEATAEITLDEAYRGTTRLIDIDGKRLEITIPPGADTGSRIKLSGRGPGGGDLIVVVKMSPDRRFTRRGADLERDLPLTLEEALLGGEVPVTTLKGRVLLTIPAGTQPGRTFRLNGQGMPRFKATGHGDLYVKARVALPTDLSDEARAAAKAFFDLVDQPDPR
jgi:curved DNA-binding protein